MGTGFWIRPHTLIIVAQQQRDLAPVNGWSGSLRLDHERLLVSHVASCVAMNGTVQEIRRNNKRQYEVDEAPRKIAANATFFKLQIFSKRHTYVGRQN